MKKFSDIEQFRHVLRNVQHKTQFTGRLDDNGDPIMNRLAVLPKLNCSSTTKIHGSNMSVVIDDDNFYCQSRNNVITIDNDCYGFTRWVHTWFPNVINNIKSLFGNHIVIFGEFAGKGIQDIVAVSQLEKFWTIFRIENLDTGEWIDFKNVDLSHLNQYRVYSIYQFGIESLEIDFEHPAVAINKMNELTLAVEKECPVGKFFGISSTGEGRVWTIEHPDYRNSKFVWKIKGSEHSKSKLKKLANVDVEKMANIEAFVSKHLSEERLMQAYNWLGEQKKSKDETSTGEFIKWLFNDIIKEESDELTASGLTTKDLGGVVAKNAKIWYFKKIGG
jgi:RNA ligase